MVMHNIVDVYFLILDIYIYRIKKLDKSPRQKWRTGSQIVILLVTE